MHLALFLLIGGTTGTVAGVWLFTALRSADMLDLLLAISYVILLGIVGSLMVVESMRAIARSARGRPVVTRKAGSHAWVLGLPLKIRFKRSGIYVSAIPVCAIGLIIGFLGAIMGIGGGFILVPMLIYLLRVPTRTVIGTSTLLTLATMIASIILHAVTNHLIDAVLAIILMIGGVIGAQFGARASLVMRPERLRLLLGLLVLCVGARFAVEIFTTPAHPYSLRVLEGGV